MGHSDQPGDGCRAGRRNCGGNLLVNATSERPGRRSREGFVKAFRALRSVRSTLKRSEA